jgi:hypothetical protein
MEVATGRARFLVGAFATVVIFGSGVGTAVVTSNGVVQPTAGRGANLDMADEVTATTGARSRTGTTTTTRSDESTTPPSSDPGTTVNSAPGPATNNSVPSVPNNTIGTTPTTTAVVADAPSSELACGAGDWANHGQFVSSQPQGGEARSDAAHSDCGKPPNAGKDDEATQAPPSGDVAPADPSSGNGNAYGHTKR